MCRDGKQEKGVVIYTMNYSLFMSMTFCVQAMTLALSWTASTAFTKYRGEVWKNHPLISALRFTTIIYPTEDGHGACPAIKMSRMQLRLLRPGLTKRRRGQSALENNGQGAIPGNIQA